MSNTLSESDPNKIAAEESTYLVVSTSQLPESGKGLFTTIDIYKEEIIAIYKGEILTNEEALERSELGLDRYFVSMLDGSIMDSENTECFAKYANDARGFNQSIFKNNSKIMIDDDGSVYLIATQKIKAGSEIFCSYGYRYWKNQKEFLSKTK